MPGIRARVAHRVGLLFDSGQPLRRATCAILLPGPLFIVPASLKHRRHPFNDNWMQGLERRGAGEEPIWRRCS